MKNALPRHNRFLGAILFAASAAAFVGTLWPSYAVHAAFLGDLFLNALKMMVLPLIIFSLVCGVANLGDVRKLGSLGSKTLFYYLTTTALAVLVGIFLVDSLKPGLGFNGPLAAGLQVEELAKQVSISSILTGFFHPNLIQAAANYDILPLITASLLFGIALASFGERAASLVRHMNLLNEAVMKIIKGIIWFTPLGVFGLIASQLGEVGGGYAVVDLGRQLGKYTLTVLLGLLFHGCLVLPFILWAGGKRNPLIYAVQSLKALITAFSTSSSSATLPVTVECTTKEAGVSEKTAGIVLPVGATINMDGTALYEAVAAIFIAQAYGIELGFSQQLIIFITATVAAIGAAGIPQAGLVTMVLVLQSVGLPAEGIGFILAIDWFLDRCRTTVNVWGDMVGAAVIERWESP